MSNDKLEASGYDPTRPPHPYYEPQLSMEQILAMQEPVRARDSVAHQSDVKKARDRAQYVRQQRGHSFLLHWVVLGIFSLFIVPLYYTFSPNHYWHL